MAAIELLKGQHREVERVLGHLHDVQGGARVRLLGELAERLTLHTALEERYFYPVLRVEGLTHLVERSFAEHAEVKRLVSEVMEMKQRDPRLEGLISRLEAAVRKHVQEEETEVFPRAQERIDEAVMQSCADEMRQAMRALEEEEVPEVAASTEGAAPA